jgi:hypothetical protein
MKHFGAFGLIAAIIAVIAWEIVAYAGHIF